MKAEITKILSAAAPSVLAEGIVESFVGLERAFVLKQWKVSGLDSGHFVEMVRRFIDHATLGSFTPIGTSLPPLNEDELKKIASRNGPESYRLLIPRALFAIYSLRNKRGIGHTSEVAANGMDASIILSACKWVLSEILRVCSNLSTSETSALVERLSERYIDGFWSQDGIERILVSGLTAREQILFYLFNRSPASPVAIEKASGAALPYIKKTLKKLHSERLVQYDAKAGNAILLPGGHLEAESLIKAKSLL
jgi:hypothetical protein